MPAACPACMHATIWCNALCMTRRENACLFWILHGTAPSIVADRHNAGSKYDAASRTAQLLQSLQSCGQSIAAAARLVEELLGSAGGCGDGVREAMHGAKHGDALLGAWRHTLQLGRLLPVLPCSSACPVTGVACCYVPHISTSSATRCLIVISRPCACVRGVGLT